MNTKPGTPGNATFEAVSIPPQKTWFDPIGVRFFVNVTKDTLTIRFGHNMRTVEVIEIAEATKENKNSAAVKALEGEIIEESI